MLRKVRGLARETCCWVRRWTVNAETQRNGFAYGTMLKVRGKRRAGLREGTVQVKKTFGDSAEEGMSQLKWEYAGHVARIEKDVLVWIPEGRSLVEGERRNQKGYEDDIVNAFDSWGKREVEGQCQQVCEEDVSEEE